MNEAPTSAGTPAGRHFLSDIVREVRRVTALGYYDYMPSPSVTLSLARPSLSAALRSVESSPAVILELKHSSPGYGDDAVPEMSASRFVRVANAAGAQALSVIPQPEAFGGSLEEFAEVARATPLPVLFKDFVLSVEQMEAARACGASAVLLLARLSLSLDMDLPLADMVEAAHRLGMEAVIEVHSSKEIDLSLDARPDVIGVNARDLESLTVDAAGALAVFAELPHGTVPLVAMSGIRDPTAVQRYQRAGADGILVGTAFLRNDDPESFVQSLRVEGTQP